MTNSCSNFNLLLQILDAFQATGRFDLKFGSVRVLLLSTTMGGRVSSEYSQDPGIAAVAAELTARYGSSLQVERSTQRELTGLNEMCSAHVLVASRTDLAHTTAVLCERTLVFALPGQRTFDYLPNVMVAECAEQNLTSSVWKKPEWTQVSSGISKDSVTMEHNGSDCNGLYQLDTFRLMLALKAFGLV